MITIETKFSRKKVLSLLYSSNKVHCAQLSPMDEGIWSTMYNLNDVGGSMYCLDFTDRTLDQIKGGTTPVIFRGKLYRENGLTRIKGDFEKDKAVNFLCNAGGILGILIGFQLAYSSRDEIGWCAVGVLVMVFALVCGWGIPGKADAYNCDAHDYMKKLLKAEDVK